MVWRVWTKKDPGGLLEYDEDSFFWGYVSSYTELIGGFLLIIGLFTRAAAFAVMINMLVATLIIGLNKFFTGGGMFPFTLMICSLVILLAGPMAYSIDAILTRKRSKINHNY